MPSPATFAETPPDAVGRPCPYCQSQLAAGDAAAECGDCGAVHHTECWEENSGCAIPGCASGPDPNVIAAEPVLPPSAMEAPGGRIAITMDGDGTARTTIRAERRAPVHAPSGTPSTPRRSWRGWAAGAMLVAAVAGAAAFALGGEEESTVGVQSASGEERASAATGVPSQAESVTQMQDAVRRYLVAIDDGDRDAAWAALSSQRQTLNASLSADNSIDAWWELQTRIREHLVDPAGATVTIADVPKPFDRSAGVISVDVQPLGWTNRTCEAFQGRIWGRWQGEGWTLEPEQEGLPPSKPARMPLLPDSLGYGCE